MELCCIVITVVDNNKTLEDKITSVGALGTEGGLCDGQVLGDDGIDPRKVENHHRSGTKRPSIIPSIVTNITLLDYFLILSTMDYIKGTMLPGMNRRLPEGGPHVSEHELIKWLGVWLVMGCYEGNWGRRYW